MSADNHKILILAGLAGFYLMSKKGAVGSRPVGYGGLLAPRSMPGSVGSGTSQIVAGALSGFVQGVLTGPRNNGGSQYVQPIVREGYTSAVQDIASDPGAASSGDWLTGWTAPVDDTANMYAGGGFW